jgi:Uma2 family endonuclease
MGFALGFWKMATAVRFEERFEIPLSIQSLAEFRRWALSDSFPDWGRIDYIAGYIEVDMSPEDLHTHGKLKVELVRVLAQRVKKDVPGELYTDRARVSCPEADLSAEPDLVFVSDASLDSKRVRLVPKAGGGPDRYIELEGPPEVVVEIVSDASVLKDRERLPAAYYRAGVNEYWLIDARGEELPFRIHHRGPSRFEPTQTDTDGYRFSTILDRWYRLHRTRNPQGRVAFDLLEKPGTREP